MPAESDRGCIGRGASAKPGPDGTAEGYGTVWLGFWAVPHPLGEIVQIAYVVNDVTTGARRWAERFGAGPFFVRHHIPVHDATHRGRPTHFDHSNACGQWGRIMVELVQDHGTGPSVVRDLFAPGEEGLHHVACFVDDIDEAIAGYAALGHELAGTGNAYGLTRFCYIDTTAERGHLTELYEPSGRLRDFYAMVAEAADGWDGSDPVRLRD